MIKQVCLPADSSSQHFYQSVGVSVHALAYAYARRTYRLLFLILCRLRVCMHACERACVRARLCILARGRLCVRARARAQTAVLGGEDFSVLYLPRPQNILLPVLPLPSLCPGQAVRRNDLH